MNTLARRSSALLGLTLVAMACQDAVLEPPDGDTGALEMVFDMAPAAEAGFAVDEAVITLQRADGGDPTILTIPIVDGSAVVDVNLRPGSWDIVVELFEAGELVGTGTGSALVRPGFVTEVDITIELTTGGVKLHIHWGAGFTGVVADLSERPVRVEIEGIGAFRVHGLSRIGWDVEVLESPTEGGRTHKDPGGVSFPDVVMLDLTSNLLEVQALAAWIADPATLRAMTIDLVGLGGEYARVALFEVAPVDGDPTILPTGPVDDYTLGGVRLAISTDLLETVPTITLMELLEYAPVEPLPVCPAPGQRIEVSGVAMAPCYPEGVLHVPAPGSSDPLYLPGLRDGNIAHDWALAVRLDIQANGCVGCGLQLRRSGSVISLDASAMETGRVNFFEAWPSSFTFFDPEVEYGHGYLFGIDIVNDLVEDAL